MAQGRPKALMGSKEQNKLVFGAQEHLKGPWDLSFFFHGLQSTLFTTVGSQRTREIIISGKRAKKSAMVRRVPTSWSLLDLSRHLCCSVGVEGPFADYRTSVLLHPIVVCAGRGGKVAVAGLLVACACSGRGAAICVRVFSSVSHL